MFVRFRQSGAQDFFLNVCMSLGSDQSFTEVQMLAEHICQLNGYCVRKLKFQHPLRLIEYESKVQ